MTRYAPLWLQSGSYAAGVDRRLLAALWPAARCDGMAVSSAGAGMALNIAAGTAAIPAANGTGSVLCASDAIETVTLEPAPPAGTNRIDLVICQPRGADLDGGPDNDFVFAYVKGAEAASPVVPATPAGALVIAQVHVTGGAASIAAGDITDVRPGSLAVGQAPRPPLAAGAPLQSYTAADGEVWVAKGGVYGGAWKKARDVIDGRWWRAAAFTVVAFAMIPLDTVTRDPYGLLVSGRPVAPVAGLYAVTASVGFTGVAGQVYTTQIRQAGGAVASVNTYPGANGFPTVRADDIVQCAAGGTIELWGRAGASSTGSAAAAETFLSIHYLGTG